MSGPYQTETAAGALPRRLFYFNGGFLRQPRLRRILALAGHDLRIGRPGPKDGVIVWGHSPYAARGAAVAAKLALPLVRVEDTFLRSIRPGRAGDPPMGLMIDETGGVHFDSAAPSALERILARDPLDDSNLLMRARDGMARLQTLDLSKYNLHQTDAPLPPPGYVLVIDQTRGDASITHAGATAASFAQMLAQAEDDHPGVRIIIKTHPETALGLRPGHFGPEALRGRTSFCTDLVSPWALLAGAVAVYTVSSQLGFEAILAGHKPQVFGQPFYAGWGQTVDQLPPARRGRALSRAQLFAAAMIIAPTWYDPCRDRLCNFEAVVDQLEAETRSFREDRSGYVATGMRMWKRGRLQEVFGQHKALIFEDNPQKSMACALKEKRPLLIWAGKATPALSQPGVALRVEDGFLRSRGLGAELVPPLSLVTDDLGIYYDPSRPSRLESLIQSPLPPGGRLRAERLITSLIAARISKYNLGAKPGPAENTQCPRILVVGQVEDDASIRLGAGPVATNLALLRAARQANPAAHITYKPHPDVEAGLRPGLIAPADIVGLADTIAHQSDPLTLIDSHDEVWTMTSLLGFEALLRKRPVVCLGAPFYAGWGLTRDLGPVPERRRRAPDGHPLPRPDLIHLAHATLIAYPRYFDPVSRRPCPPEVVIERLSQGSLPPRSLRLRLLAKLQGRLAGFAHLWR